jgi:hypothetical protein
MAKAKKPKKPKKPKKERAKKYDPKLSIDGTFDDVIGVSVGKKPEERKEDIKPKKSKK